MCMCVNCEPCTSLPVVAATPCRFPKKGRNLAKPAKNDESPIPQLGFCSSHRLGVRLKTVNRCPGEPRRSPSPAPTPQEPFHVHGNHHEPDDNPTHQHPNSNTPTPEDSAPRWPPDCSMSRSFRPPRTSCPWLSLLATRSRACGSALPVGACRRTGRGYVRGWRVAVVGGCGEWCGSRGGIDAPSRRGWDLSSSCQTGCPRVLHHH
jgi:hypothetical protein